MSTYKTLLNHNLIKKKNILKLSNQTRDIKSTKVFVDKNSNIVFLKKYVLKKNHYENSIFKDGKYALDDTKRRLKKFHKILKNNSILDIGFGDGSFLVKNKISSSKFGVEVNKKHLNDIKKHKKITVSNNVNIKNKFFDVITMFHVLEHINEPIQFLKKIKLLMKKNSKLIIEVPSANDCLILQKNEKFLKHTLWSEHLILHTKKSLNKFCQLAGFSKIKVYNIQRYNFNNHLNWIMNGKPCGHETFKIINYKKKNRYV